MRWMEDETHVTDMEKIEMHVSVAAHNYEKDGRKDEKARREQKQKKHETHADRD